MYFRPAYTFAGKRSPRSIGGSHAGRNPLPQINQRRKRKQDFGVLAQISVQTSGTLQEVTMQPVLASYIISQTLISLVLANTPQWNCPSNSRYCYQSIQQPQTWNQTRSYCASIGAQLPGARHLVSFFFYNFYNRNR